MKGFRSLELRTPDLKKLKALLILTSGLAFISPGVNAHHSDSIYDQQSEVTVEGRIIRYDWRNPHVYLWVEEETGSGKRVTWEIEGQPPAILKRHGWTQDQLKVGDHVVVKGNPGRNREKNIVLLDSIVKPDNTLLSMETLFADAGEMDAAISQRADSLDGTWATLLNYSQIVQLIEPSNLKLTDKGLAAIQAFDEARDSPGLECIPYTAPILMLAPDVKRIEMRDEAIIIGSEFEATERIVHLNVDTHDGAIDSVQGHSIGHWEGSTLVIDTAKFVPHRQGIANRLPSGRNKHLIERLGLSEDGTHLIYSFKLEDPEYLAQPIIGENIQWSYRPDLVFEVLPCDLDTAQRFAE